MQNQAVIDIETYYTLRVENEKLKHRALELEKGEILRLNESIEKLKKGLLVVLTQGSRASTADLPPYEVTVEGNSLVLVLKSNMLMTEKFKDVQVKIR
jgi:hypothetical protein